VLILFCGAGALGSTTLTLCRNLPASLAVVDFDRVEAKNLLSQAYTRQAVGKNKAEALRLQLRTFYGVEMTAYPVRLAGQNVATVAAGADLLVDCFDNAASRRVLLDHARATGTPSVHAGLAADGTFGLVRWGERFVPDEEDEPGQATCAGGEHLPFIGLVAATLAGVVEAFVRTGDRRDAAITPA
jgi:molybdopterin/thiamine biosynthesis adenylyltransferase